jgi:hypothetical protein
MSSEPLKGDAINWAVFRPAWQSTTYTFEGVPLAATFAVDDKLDSNLPANHACSHTELGGNSFPWDISWWAVDLGQSIRVSNVVIIGRSDSSQQRLANFEVGVTPNDPLAITPVPGEFRKSMCSNHGPYTDYRLDLACIASTQPGRYVVVQFSNQTNYLVLCEVQVFGTPV